VENGESSEGGTDEDDGTRSLDSREEDGGQNGTGFTGFVDGLHPGVVESCTGPAVWETVEIGREVRRRRRDAKSNGC